MSTGLARFRAVVLVVVLVAAAFIIRAGVQGRGPAASPPPAAAPVVPHYPAAVGPLRAVADSFVAAYQAGGPGGAGGRVWLDRLATVASPALVKALAFTDPETISVAPVESVGDCGAGRALVTLTDGSTLLLTVSGGLVTSVGRGDVT